jgi:hypothetical protein
MRMVLSQVADHNTVKFTLLVVVAHCLLTACSSPKNNKFKYSKSLCCSSNQLFLKSSERGSKKEHRPSEPGKSKSRSCGHLTRFFLSTTSIVIILSKTLKEKYCGASSLWNSKFVKHFLKSPSVDGNNDVMMVRTGQNLTFIL